MSKAEVLVQQLIEKGQPEREDYQAALECLDEAVCEAIAVGQVQAGRIAGPCVGYATYVFARMCAHGAAAIRAAPLSRWVEATMMNGDSTYWHAMPEHCWKAISTSTTSYLRPTRI